MTGDLIFHQEIKVTRTNYQISQSRLHGLLLLAAFPYIAQWQSIHAVWGLNRALVSLRVAVQLHSVG